MTNLKQFELNDWNYRVINGWLHKTILRKDIERGVKFLNESAYSEHWGVTRSSAIFLKEVAKHVDLGKVYRVDFKHNQKDWYTVRIFTKDGYTIQLKGFSFGYWGEGSRGSLALLNALGFSERQLKKVIKENHADEKSFRLYKRLKGAC